MASILKIKNTVAFLKENNPAELQQLKEKYPDNIDILEGKEKYGAEDHADTPEKQQAVLAVTLKGLQNILMQVTPLQDKLRHRLQRAKSLRLIASIIAVCASTILAALLTLDKGSFNVKITVAAINMVAAVLPLVAQYMETSKYGGDKNLLEYLNEVNAVLAEAKSNERLLQKDLELNNYDDDTVKIIKNTDEKIFAKLSEIQEQLK